MIYLNVEQNKYQLFKSCFLSIKVKYVIQQKNHRPLTYLIYENDFFKGTPDLIIKDTVYDIKCSWDEFTFPLFENEIPTKDYYYQLQVYMNLLGLKKAVLVYVLLDSPENLPSWETPKTYSHLDKKYRIKKYDVEYSEDVIADLQQRVTNIREFIKTLNNE